MLDQCWCTLRSRARNAENRNFKIWRDDGNENVKKKKVKKKKNNFAQASHYFVHFFAVFARLRQEIS